MSRINFLLQHLLNGSAQKYPDKTAIIENEYSLTYKELDNKSTQLANLLIKTGIRQKEVVAVIMHKSIEMIISMFAVLKAGCAYIPVDPHYLPDLRIYTILNSSECTRIITHRAHWEGLSKLAENSTRGKTNTLSVFLIEGILSEQKQEDCKEQAAEENIEFYYFDNKESNQLMRPSNAISQDLAYILYTSGSTGIPKGVMISHINALTFVNWSLNCFKPAASDIFSCFAPLHFDLSVFDIYVSLASGACVSLVSFNIGSNPRSVIEWARKQNITIWYSVPSLWVSIINYTNIAENPLPALRYILFAGEVFPAKYLKKLMSYIPRASYYNLYGPTETNVCTYYKVNSINDVTDKPVPIGIPCENTDVIAVTSDDKLAAEGEEGELLVRGSIVTKGYYKNPEKTGKAFRESPLKEHNGAQFYITSDIVKKLKNGFEYIGRKDLMVKCAGFRVEIGEVECAFYKNDMIEEAVVIPFSDSASDTTRLYAMVKPKNDTISSIEVKKQLTNIIPKYMVPEFIEFVDNIYKNQNGKFDRPRLAALVQKKFDK